MSSYLSPVIQHNDQRIFVKGSIKEKEIDFLLDTGAEITVIPTKLAQGLNIPYKKTKLCLTGVIGEDSVLYETPPIEVQFGPKTLTTKLLCAPLNTGAILGMDLLRQINLTLDMSSESTSIKISSAQISTNNATPPEYVFLQNHPIWAKDKDDCGLLTGVEPVKLTGTPPPVTKQYPINKEAIQGIKLIVENLLTQGVLVKTNSPCNSPIWPIKKSNGTWRLTIDYRVANKHIEKITPLVADPSTICNGLPLNCKIFSVIDMSNGFFSVPLHSDSQPWLAFTVDYEQYQWTRLPQGFQNSPTIYHQAVRRDLCDPECPVKQSTMIQYVDDILIASTDHEVHQTELASLLDYLHKKGHKCSFHKAQVAKKQVTFLGQTIGAGNRSITQDRAASVKAIPPPNTIKTLRSFLGTTGYCRPWIEDYASMAQPLYDLLKGHGKDSDTVCMEELHLKAFNDLKRALCQAPELGIAQSDRPFVLYVHEHLGFMTACLMQDHGGSLRPIHYYSGKLDIVAQGMGPCLRAVQAVHLALQASSGMVLGQTVNVKCPHAVSALMNQAKVTSVTSSRWGNWLATLTAPNIVIQRAPVTNPSSCMMSAMTEFVLEDEGEMTHDCVTLTYAATSEIAETPIENAELELFVDGSAQVIEGNRRAGYAVTSTTEVVASGRLPDHFSAQAAELVALTRACTLASGSVANIYTDSRYAFGVIHDFGVIWQTRKFLTSAGSPIKHAGLVKDLMFAMKLPKKLAVIKVKAHLTTNTTEAKGNALADVAAKQACFYATVQVCSGSTAQKIILPPESIVDLYKDVPLYEAWTWLDKGATVDSSGCWTKGGKYVAPESLLPYLAQQIHSLGHSGPATMNHRFSNQWWNPKFRNAATETVKRCVTCQKNNDVPATITPAAHTPAPPGPFRHLQVDYISLPPCKGKTDVLVVIDKFSRWVEAYPTGRATAAHTAKCLVTDFIPRWGLPDCIDSDQGTHFTGQVVKEVSRMLKVKWNLHCPYRPQASGQVERSNRTIKTRLSKMHQEGVPWVEALPAVLCSMRASPNRSVGLSPHEIITGRPMQMPGVIDLRNADVHIASDALIAYCENLTKAVQSAKERVESCWQTPPEGGHTIVPGQWVMIKTFKNKPLEPKWYGPHQVMLITAAAVLCQGRKTWTHVSHIKVVPPPAGIG